MPNMSVSKNNLLCKIGRSHVYKHDLPDNRTRYSVKSRGVVTAHWVEFKDLPYHLKETVAKAIHSGVKNHA